MKKYILLLLATITMWSCSDSESFPSDLLLQVRGYSEQELYTYGFNQNVYLWTTKGWADGLTTNLEYKIEQSVLDNFNTENGTSYKMAPSDSYSAVQSTYELTDENYVAKFKVSVDPAKLVAHGELYDTVNYVLAYRIYKNGVAVADPYGSVVVGLKVGQPLIDAVQETVPTCVYNENEDFVEVTYRIESSVECRGDFDIQVTNDPSMTAAYSLEHGLTYNHIPISAVQFYEDSITFAKGSKEKVIHYFIEKSALQEGYNLLPIKAANIPDYYSIGSSDMISYYNVAKITQTIPISELSASCQHASEGNASKIIDGNTGSGNYVQNNYGTSNSSGEWWAEVDLSDLSKSAFVYGVNMWLRPYNAWNHGQTHCKLYVSDDPTASFPDAWTLAGEFTFLENADGNRRQPYFGKQTALFDAPVTTKCVRVYIDKFGSAYGDGANVAFFGEIQILGSIN